MNTSGRSSLMVIDNYDSFTFNLVQMFLQYPLQVDVFRSDNIQLSEIESRRPDYILISPGPKSPAFTGISMPLIRSFFKQIPILGVCLGMQCIGEVFGGRTVRAPVPMHGKTSAVLHSDTHLFQGVPSPFSAARYHSLMTQVNHPEIEITATSEDGIVMGISHPEYPLHGVQFHPESFLTDHGFTLIENFLKLGPLTCPGRIHGLSS
jgi:anthranilate synthase component 2